MVWCGAVWWGYVPGRPAWLLTALHCYRGEVQGLDGGLRDGTCSRLGLRTLPAQEHQEEAANCASRQAAVLRHGVAGQVHYYPTHRLAFLHHNSSCSRDARYSCCWEWWEAGRLVRVLRRDQESLGRRTAARSLVPFTERRRTAARIHTCSIITIV